jgi:hypothetical protein
MWTGGGRVVVGVARGTGRGATVVGGAGAVVGGEVVVVGATVEVVVGAVVPTKAPPPPASDAGADARERAG